MILRRGGIADKNGVFMNKKISVLGASGSVGTQALDVARSRGYEIDFISVGKNAAVAEAAAREFKVKYLAVENPDAYSDLKTRLADTDVKLLFGEAGILEGISLSESECAVNSIIGEAGLKPTLAVIEAGKRLALANKESLVIAGEIVMKRARERGAQILPVDSEHSAIFQSLKSGRTSEIKKIILTASGGPFFGRGREELRSVTLADTLAHPTWKMGKKITVDSATLMNKGFEVIEAAHLFGVSADNIEVTVHRESILHSAVEYIDNAVIGEFSVPDMRMCVQYAVDYPDRMPTASEELDLFKIGKLTFQRPDESAFPLLALARRSMLTGGAAPALLNAADEIAVAAFLEERLSFLGISEVVEAVYLELEKRAAEAKELDAIVAFDREARLLSEKFIGEKRY